MAHEPGRLRSMLSVLMAGTSAAIAAAAVVLGAAGLEWLVGSPILAGALAMILSGMLIIGFGGIQLPWWAFIAVGLSWVFADEVLAWLNVPGPIGSVTMAVVYLILGMTRGLDRNQVLMAGAGPVAGLTIGVVLIAVLYSRQVAEGVEEAVLSASMISAARSARGFVEVLRVRREKATLEVQSHLNL